MAEETGAVEQKPAVQPWRLSTALVPTLASFPSRLSRRIICHHMPQPAPHLVRRCRFPLVSMIPACHGHLLSNSHLV